MDLNQNGRFIRSLRKSNGMTQKEVAERLGVLPKTVSKWETGHGFPDISLLSSLADLFGVSERSLLFGDCTQNHEDVGNLKTIQFFFCPQCGSVLWGTGNSQITCCGKKLSSCISKKPDEEHRIDIVPNQNEYTITFRHEMNKNHFIVFVSYVTYDRIVTIRLYPEQDSVVHFPKTAGGNLYFYCNRHGLFQIEKIHQQEERTPGIAKKEGSLTALLSAFSKIYSAEQTPFITTDPTVKRLFSRTEYHRLQSYLPGDKLSYVNHFLAPTPLAREKFGEECLANAVLHATTQYVLLGSGLDLSAFHHLDLSIFEVDRSSVLNDKKRRLIRAGFSIPKQIHYICTDLSKQPIGSLLNQNGFQREEKSLFSAFGLLYYLSNQEIASLLCEISRIAAPGSSLIFDIADGHLFSSEIPRVKTMLAMAEQSGEPMKSCFSYQELESLLEESGFFIYEFLNPSEIQKRYFSDCDGKLTAFEHIDYVLAVKR